MKRRHRQQPDGAQTFLITLIFLLVAATSCFASATVDQTPLLGTTIPKYVEPMPVFGPADTPRVDGTQPVTVRMEEVKQQVLPAPFAKTSVWGYKVGDAPTFYPGVTLEVKRGTPTDVTWVNALPINGGEVQNVLSVDQTIHWANPNETTCAESPLGLDANGYQ